MCKETTVIYGKGFTNISLCTKSSFRLVEMLKFCGNITEQKSQCENPKGKLEWWDEGEKCKVELKQCPFNQAVCLEE